VQKSATLDDLERRIQGLLKF